MVRFQFLQFQILIMCRANTNDTGENPWTAAVQNSDLRHSGRSRCNGELIIISILQVATWNTFVDIKGRSRPAIHRACAQHLHIFCRPSNPSRIVDDQTFDRARYGRGLEGREEEGDCNLTLVSRDTKTLSTGSWPCDRWRRASSTIWKW